MTPPDPRTDDHALLARITNGDRIALEQLYRRHAPWLTARLQARCGDAECVDLAVQDTFLAVWRKPGSYRGTGDVGAWIWGIGIRRLIDQLRRRRDRPVDVTVAAGRGDAAFGVTAGADAAALAGSGAAHDALATLDPELRAVMVATAIDGLSTKEAGRLLGIPQGTVKTRLMRARRELQEVLR